MMKILIIACSVRAYELMHSLSEKLKKAYDDIEITQRVKCSALGDISSDKSIYELTAEFFEGSDALVFICSAGIAVRSIAPLISHKSRDPAVIVMDEGGRHCISLLSGHYGGANELALKISSLMGSEPVITTATDIEGKFSPDSFALKNGLAVTDWQKSKEASARILQGERLGLYSELPTEGRLPGELFLCGIENADIVISHKTVSNGALLLVPKSIALGIGCKKDTPLYAINEGFKKFLQYTGISEQSIFSLSSIDIKKDEKGLLMLSAEKNIPIAFYSADELKALKGSFSRSDFVEEVTGVDNVCERCAVLCSGGELLYGKKAYNGVTFAAAARKGAVLFE